MDFQELVWKEPWLAPIALNLTALPTNQLKTAGVTPDEKTLYYNPRYWEKLHPSEQLAVQIHELLHIANLHSARRKEREWERWNAACDMSINHLIRQADYILPAGTYEGDPGSAEEIYDRLKEVKPVTFGSDLLKYNQDGSTNSGDLDTLVAVERAKSMIIRTGRGSTKLSQQFKSAATTVDWRIILRQYIRSALGDELDFISYEFDEFGICEDILLQKPTARICVLVDESGSISERLYQQFLGELFKMTHSAKVYASGFADGTKLRAVPIKKYCRTMTGGTDVIPSYEQACKENYDCIIVLTDGYLDFPSIEPIPTIWAMPKSFGRKTEVLIS